MELRPRNAQGAEQTGKRSLITVIMFGLLFVGWVGEWPIEIDTVLYLGKWRSIFGVFAPLFAPVPGISLFAPMTQALPEPDCTVATVPSGVFGGNEPLPPGGIVHGVGGTSAVVQWHCGWTLKTVSGLAVRLVKLNVKSAASWSAAAFVVFIAPSHAMMPSGRGSFWCVVSGT